MGSRIEKVRRYEGRVSAVSGRMAMCSGRGVSREKSLVVGSVVCCGAAIGFLSSGFV